MRTLFAGLLAVAAFASSASSEVIVTTDGRSVDLRDDGTYEFVAKPKPADADYIELQEAYFEHNIGDYERKMVRFMPIYINIGDKKIVGIKFTSTF